MKKNISKWADELGINRRKLSRRLQYIQEQYPNKKILSRGKGIRARVYVDMVVLGEEIDMVYDLMPVKTIEERLSAIEERLNMLCPVGGPVEDQK